MNKLIVFMVSVTMLLWGAFLWTMSDKVNPDGRAAAVEELDAGEKKLDFGGLLVRLEPQPQPAQGLRDPFRLPKAYMPASKIVRHLAKKDSLPAATPSIPRPAIALDAILPGDNPVAILKFHGESAVVSVGQEIWGVTVTSIEAERVTVRFDGTSFSISLH